MIRAVGLASVLAAAAATASAGRFPVVAARADARPAAVITLSWEHRGIPKGMSVYEPGPGAASLPLWHTSTAARLKDVPVAAELRAGEVKLRPGEKRRLLLVYRNPGKAPVRFFAAPHHARPEESSLGFEFACLCMNHVYTAPPGEFWWRVVELQLDEDFAAGALDVRHVLLPPALKNTLGKPLQ